MSEPRPTIFDRSVPGHRAAPPFVLDVPRRPIDELLPTHLRRSRPAALPEVTEQALVEHYIGLTGAKE